MLNIRAYHILSHHIISYRIISHLRLSHHYLGEAQWSLCVTCGAWLALSGFDHLTFHFDREVLLSVVLPSLRGVAEFFLGTVQIQHNDREEKRGKERRREERRGEERKREERKREERRGEEKINDLKRGGERSSQY